MSEIASTDEERSDGIWALIEAATPGPWETRQTDDGRFYGQPPTFDVVSVADNERQEPVVCGGPAEAGGPTLGAAEGPDAAFIAAARDLVPLLLAEADRLRGVVHAVRELHRKITTTDDFGFCTGCEFSWPCPTAALVAGVPVDSTEEAQK